MNSLSIVAGGKLTLADTGVPAGTVSLSTGSLTLGDALASACTLDALTAASVHGAQVFVSGNYTQNATGATSGPTHLTTTFDGGVAQTLQVNVPLAAVPALDSGTLVIDNGTTVTLSQASAGTGGLRAVAIRDQLVSSNGTSALNTAGIGVQIDGDGTNALTVASVTPGATQATASALTFMGGAGGSWSSPSTLAGNAWGAVTIDGTAGLLTIVENTASPSVGSLSVVNNGALTLTGGSTITSVGAINLGLSTLTVPAAATAIISQGGYFQTNGSVSIVGTLSNLTTTFSGSTATQTFQPDATVPDQGDIVISDTHGVTLTTGLGCEALTVNAGFTLTANANVMASGAVNFTTGTFSLAAADTLQLIGVGPQTLTMGTSSVGGKLQIGGAKIVGPVANANAAVNAIANKLNVTGTTTIADGSTLSLSGAAGNTFSSLVTVSAGATGGKLTDTKGSAFNGGLSVGGTQTCALSGAAATVGGAGVSVANTATLQFNSGATVSAGGASTGNTACTLTFAGASTIAGGLTVGTSSTVNLNGTTSVTGGETVNGALSIAASGCTLNGALSITGTATVQAGAATATLGVGGSVTVNSGGHLILSDSTKLSTAIDVVAGGTLQATNAANYTITFPTAGVNIIAGTVNVNPGGANTILLVSATQGTFWTLQLKTGVSQTWANCQVRDSDASSSDVPIVANGPVPGANTTDLGHNKNWDFGTAPAAATWNGLAADGNWANPGNWVGNQLPVANGAVTINNVASLPTTNVAGLLNYTLGALGAITDNGAGTVQIDASLAVASLTVSAGTFATNANTLTSTGAIVGAGTLDASNSFSASNAGTVIVGATAGNALTVSSFIGGKVGTAAPTLDFEGTGNWSSALNGGSTTFGNVEVGFGSTTPTVTATISPTLSGLLIDTGAKLILPGSGSGTVNGATTVTGTLQLGVGTGATLNANGTLTLNGTLNDNAGASSISVSGAYAMGASATISTSANLTTTFTAGSSQNFTPATASLDVGKLIVANSGGGITLLAPMTAETLALQTGGGTPSTFSTNGKAAIFTGAVSGPGKLDASGGGNVTLGNGITAGTFGKGAGTVTFNGSGSWSTPSDMGVVTIDGGATVSQLANTVTATTLTIGDNTGAGTLKPLSNVATPVTVSGALSVGTGSNTGSFDTSNGASCSLSVAGTCTFGANAGFVNGPASNLTTTLDGNNAQSLVVNVSSDIGNLTVSGGTSTNVALTTTNASTLLADKLSVATGLTFTPGAVASTFQNTVTGVGTLAAGTGKVTVQSGLQITNYTPGTGGLVFNGTGTWSTTVSGQNYGQVTVQAGTVTLGNNVTATAATALTINGASTLAINGNLMNVVGNLVLGSAGTAGVIDGAGATISNLQVSGSYTQGVSGSGVVNFVNLTTTFDAASGTQSFTYLGVGSSPATNPTANQGTIVVNGASSPTAQLVNAGAATFVCQALTLTKGSFDANAANVNVTTNGNTTLTGGSLLMNAAKTLTVTAAAPVNLDPGANSITNLATAGTSTVTAVTGADLLKVLGTTNVAANTTLLVSAVGSLPATLNTFTGAVTVGGTLDVEGNTLFVNNVTVNGTLENITVPTTLLFPGVSSSSGPPVPVGAIATFNAGSHFTIGTGVGFSASNQTALQAGNAAGPQTNKSALNWLLSIASAAVENIQFVKVQHSTVTTSVQFNSPSAATGLDGVCTSGGTDQGYNIGWDNLTAAPLTWTGALNDGDWSHGGNYAPSGFTPIPGSVLTFTGTGLGAGSNGTKAPSLNFSQVGLGTVIVLADYQPTVVGATTISFSGGGASLALTDFQLHASTGANAGPTLDLAGVAVTVTGKTEVMGLTINDSSVGKTGSITYTAAASTVSMTLESTTFGAPVINVPLTVGTVGGSTTTLQLVQPATPVAFVCGGLTVDTTSFFDPNTTTTSVTINGSVQTNGSGQIDVSSPRAAAFSVAGNWNTTSSATALSAAMTGGLTAIDNALASSTQTFDFSGSEVFGSFTVNKTTGGTLSIDVPAASALAVTPGDLHLLAANTSAVTLVGGGINVSTGNLTIDGGSCALAAPVAPNVVKGAVSVNNAGILTLGGAGTLNVSGSWTVAATATFNCNTSTVNFIGGTQTASLVAGEPFFNVAVTNGATLLVNGPLTAGGTLSVGNATPTVGTLTMQTAAAAMTVTGNTTITSGSNLTLTAGGGTFKANLTCPGTLTAAAAASTINVAGTWDTTGGGSFAAGGSTVVFNGVTAQTVKSGAAIFNGVTTTNGVGATLFDPMTTTGPVTVTGVLDIGVLTLTIKTNVSTPLSGTPSNFLNSANSLVSFQPTTANLSFSIPSFAFQNVTFGGTTETFTTSAAFTVAGAITIGSGCTYEPGADVTATQISSSPTGSGILNTQSFTVTVTVTGGGAIVPVTVAFSNLTSATPFSTVSYTSGLATTVATGSVYGNLSLGTGAYTASTGTIALAGNLTLTTGTLTGGTSVSFSGSTNSTFDCGAASQTFGALNVNKSSLNNLVTLAGSQNALRTVTGTSTITVGELDVQCNYVFNCNMSIGTGPAIGSAVATLNLSTPLVSLTLGDPTSTPTPKTITVHHILKVGDGQTSGLKLVIGGGSTILMAENSASFAMAGTGASKLLIDSSLGAASPAIIAVQFPGATSASISALNVSVANNNANGVVDAQNQKNPILATSSIDRLGNQNWDFQGGGALIALGATALGDGTGRINRVHFVFSRQLDPSTIGNVNLQFQLQQLDANGNVLQSVVGTGTNLVASPKSDSIEIVFGNGLGRTDLTNVQVVYTPPSGNFLSSIDGVPANQPLVVNPADAATPGAGTVASATYAVLTDGAPPVLTSALALDTDGNGGLDRITFGFSEPISFGAAQGISVSDFGPTTDTTLMGGNTSLSLSVAGEAPNTIILDQTGPKTQPEQIAQAIQSGVQALMVTPPAGHNPINRPAYLNFSCTFTNGRYLLTSGVPLAIDSKGNYLLNYGGSSVSVVSGGPKDASVQLKLGLKNGGLETSGSGNALAGVSVSGPIANPNNTGLVGATANFQINGEDFRNYPISDTTIEGVASDIETSVRSTTTESHVLTNQPAYTNFVAVPDRAHSRFVFLSGTVGSDSSVIFNSSTTNTFATIALVGSNNYTAGAKEAPGKPNAGLSLAGLNVRGQNGANLLLGKSIADMQLNGSNVTINLTNVPNSGTGAPSFIWQDQGDGNFITDVATIPNLSTATFTNLASSSNIVIAGDTNHDLALTKNPGPIVLDASQSVAFVGTTGVTTTYAWTQVSGPPVTLTNANSPVLNFKALAGGTYDFQLAIIAFDGEVPPKPVLTPLTDASGQDIQLVTVTIPDQPPIANAGPSQSVVGTSATLDGSGCLDPNGGAITLLWSATGPTGLRCRRAAFSSARRFTRSSRPALRAPTAVTVAVDQTGSRSRRDASRRHSGHVRRHGSPRPHGDAGPTGQQLGTRGDVNGSSSRSGKAARRSRGRLVGRQGADAGHALRPERLQHDFMPTVVGNVRHPARRLRRARDERPGVRERDRRRRPGGPAAIGSGGRAVGAELVHSVFLTSAPDLTSTTRPSSPSPTARCGGDRDALASSRRRPMRTRSRTSPRSGSSRGDVGLRDDLREGPAR